jgi:integrase
MVNQREWSIPGQKTKRLAWGFSVTVNGKRVKSYKAEWSRDDAKAAEAKTLLQIEQPKASNGITLQQAVDRYLLAKARKKSLAEDTRQLSTLVAALGASTPLADITASRIAAWKAERLAATCTKTKAPYAVGTINRALAILRHLLRMARDEWEIIETVPKIRLEREPQGRLRWLTEEEIQALLAACAKSFNKELVPAVVLDLNTGLRKSELYGLTWDRVDLSRSVIRLEITKSGKRREMPINEAAYAALMSLGPKASGYVFTVRCTRAAYENAVEAAKLDDVNFHTLRHTFASHAMMRGMALKDLQEALGHATLAMTMRYAHLSPERLRKSFALLDGLTSTRAQGRAHEGLSLVKSA